jgi:hypothetical protein
MRLVVTDGGFALHRPGRPPASVAWASVGRIVARKRDLLTEDQVCLDFWLPREDVTFTVAEDVPGFLEVAAEMARRFPLRDPDWLARATLPPFAPGAAVIYEREGGSGPRGSA